MEAERLLLLTSGAHRVDVRTTFLGAHALPPEYDSAPDAYVDEVLRMLPQLHAEGLVDAVDAFCERIAFSTAQTAKVFDAARALGLPVKLHAEQLSNLNGAALAAGFGALSADHLEHLDEAGIAALTGQVTGPMLLTPSAPWSLASACICTVPRLVQPSASGLSARYAMPRLMESSSPLSRS